MLEELQRRNFSPSTIRGYIRTVRDFAAYFHKPPDQLGVEEVRQGSIAKTMFETSAMFYGFHQRPYLWGFSNRRPS